MSSERKPEVFLPLDQTATRLGVPIAWLRAEAHAGRVPLLHVGKRLLFNLVAIEAVLLDRAAQEVKGSAHANE